MNRRSPGAPLRAVRSALLVLVLGTTVPPAAGGGWRSPTAGESLGGPAVRVLLLESPLVTVGAAGKEGLRLRDEAGRTVLHVQAGQQLRVRRTGEAISLETLSKSPPPPLAGAGLPLEEAFPSRAQDHPRVPAPVVPQQLPLQPLTLEPIEARGLLVLKQRRYRGTLLLRPDGEGLQAINRLPLESYLAGVIGNEMPAAWPLAALRAQAVACRTYALQQLRPESPFDLRATVESQVYRGVESESAQVLEAVASTRSLVLMHGQKLINAVFHSSSGGVTENSGEMWTRQAPYLVSVPDFDATSPVSRWEKVVGPDELRKTFAEIGGAIAIQPLQASSTGRLRQARVVGPEGDLVLSGVQLRQRLGLRSTLVQFRFEPAGRVETGAGMGFPTVSLLPPSPPSEVPPSIPAALRSDLRLVVTGRGYGHGVGMSQWGAYTLALRGKSYEDILHHYYRGAVLRSF